MRTTGNMHRIDEQAQERPPLIAERAAKDARQAHARLESPLGTIADRCVEAHANLRDVQPRAALASLASSYWSSVTGNGCPGERSATPLRMLCRWVSPTFGRTNI